MGRRVLIIDDHKGVAQAVAQLLTGSGWGPFVFATRSAEALTTLDRQDPDVVVIEAALSDEDGVDLVHRISSRARPPCIVVFTGSGSIPLTAACIRSGARAVVAKDSPPSDLLAAVAAVADGGGWLHPKMLGPVLGELLQPVPPTEWEELVARLTPREQEVLELMVAGFDRPTIARRLMVSINTTRTHTKNILAKLGVHSSIEAVSVALRAGMRPPDLA